MCVCPRFGLLGASMGGAVSLMVAHAEGVNPVAVVLDRYSYSYSYSYSFTARYPAACVQYHPGAARARA